MAELGSTEVLELVRGVSANSGLLRFHSEAKYGELHEQADKASLKRIL